MTIGELSRTTGFPSSTIRFYEQEGLVAPLQRRGGRRVFDDTAVRHLQFIRVAKEAGFTLDEIRQLMGEFRHHRWRALARRKLDELDDAAKRIRTMRALLERLLACGCFDVEACGKLLAVRR